MPKKNKNPALPAKRRDLTIKQRKWLKSYLETFNASQAARDAGYKCKSDDQFGVIGYQNFKKLQTFIEKWIDDNGLSDVLIKQKLISLMNAKETRFFAFEGRVREEREVESLEVQRRTLDMIMKIKGMYAQDSTKTDLTINVQVNNDRD